MEDEATIVADVADDGSFAVVEADVELPLITRRNKVSEHLKEGEPRRTFCQFTTRPSSLKLAPSG